MRGPSREFTGGGGGSGKARHQRSAADWGPLGEPRPCPFSSLSPSETGTMLSTATLVRAGLGAGEPETDGAPAADPPFSSCSANKDVFSHVAGSCTFQSSGPRPRSRPDLAGSLPSCPRVFSLHRFPASGLHEPGDGQSLITTWLTVLLTWWAPGGRVCPSHCLATCRLQAAPAQHFLSFGSLTTAEAAAGSGTQPHTSFHDIMSADGRDIKGPGTRFMCVGTSLSC